MKLLLLHGPAREASRRKLIQEKQKFDANSVVVFEEGAHPQFILNNLVTPSLFAQEQLVILENPSEDFIGFPQTSNPFNLIFWFDHEVSLKKPIMEYVKENIGGILFFPEVKEVSVFPFLDYLAAKDKRAFLEIDKLKRGGFEVQYFLTMVFYLLRNLVSTPKNAPQFVKDKLTRQRKNFSLEKIVSLYKEILEIDFKIKSGLLERKQAEFLLINKFIG